MSESRQVSKLKSDYCCRNDQSGQYPSEDTEPYQQPPLHPLDPCLQVGVCPEYIRLVRQQHEFGLNGRGDAADPGHLRTQQSYIRTGRLEDDTCDLLGLTLILWCLGDWFVVHESL